MSEDKHGPQDAIDPMVSIVTSTALGGAAYFVVHDPVGAMMAGAGAEAVRQLAKRTIVPKGEAFMRRLFKRATTDAQRRAVLDHNPEAVMAALRQLLDADPVVVPALAELTREYVTNPPKPVDGFFRDTAQFFADLSAADYVALGKIVQNMRERMGKATYVLVQWGREIGVAAQDPFVAVTKMNDVVEHSGVALEHDEINVRIADAQRVIELMRKHNVGMDNVGGGGSTSSTGSLSTPNAAWAEPVVLHSAIVHRLHFILKAAAEE